MIPCIVLWMRTPYIALLATSCERKIAGPADPYFDRLQSW